MKKTFLSSILSMRIVRDLLIIAKAQMSCKRTVRSSKGEWISNDENFKWEIDPAKRGADDLHPLS